MDIIWFENCSYKNKNLVGGKNASLGELKTLSEQLNFNIADGFAITVNLYEKFIKRKQVNKKIEKILKDIDVSDIEKLNIVSSKIKDLITHNSLLQSEIDCIVKNFDKLKSNYNSTIQVAVRSSAIAEDMPGASFAGQQDTYLNIESNEDLIKSIIKCYASLFNSRAISYRHTNNIDFSQVKMSVTIQKMVRSDIGSAGVAFSIDPETGYNKAIVINSAFGLGELVVSGGVKPDEIVIDKRALKENAVYPIISKKLGHKKTKIVYSKSEFTDEVDTSINEYRKFSIENEDCICLSKSVLSIETAYKNIFGENNGVDIEWALDGIDNKIYILQARPETIHSNNKNCEIKKYILKEKSEIILEGVSVGEKITTGKVCCLDNISQHKLFNEGDILVTNMTTPDWEPLMKKSSGIITNKGGRTCHAAIVARELGINAIVGTTNGTNILRSDDNITMSCAQGEIGFVYKGILEYQVERFSVNIDEKLPVNLMLNVGSPENCFSASILPNSGVGLARLEFIINNYIKIHPLALLDYPNIESKTKKEIDDIIVYCQRTGAEYFINKLARGVAKIASSFYPKPVIIRLSDFKSNEYKNLIGGNLYEPDEENPMIGWRGASRYYSNKYIKAFNLECMAMKFAIDNINMNNIILMIPFCRTPEECEKVLEVLKNNGLERGKNNLKIYLMCEIPSNVIEADNFSKLVDGVSIGGNDLLQLTLGIDRDSDMISNLSDHRNVSYRRMITQAIKMYKKYGVKVGFCGQQPSDSSEFAKFLVDEGIDSISVTPDSVLNLHNILKE